MENYILKTNFSNFTLIVKNVNCTDYLHFSLTLEVITSKFNLSYNFEEMIYWQLPFYKKENKLEIYDECNTDCKCNLNKEKFELIIKDEEKSNITIIKLNKGEDQEKLFDFINELIALCETIFQSNKQN